MFCSLHSKELTQEFVEKLRVEVPDVSASISPQGRKLMEFRYLQDDETVEDRLYGACVAFATDYDHAVRLATYISKGWFMFATPVLANGGTSRGLPIACFLNLVPDSVEGLSNHFAENIAISVNGGGIGSTYSDVRSVGTSTSKGSQTTGIIPFMKVNDSIILGFSQGVQRRGANAIFLDLSHPEIREFLEVRTPEGGDFNRKCFQLHLGVNITDKFMQAVKADADWELIDPHSKRVTEVVKAKELFKLVIKSRIDNKGEPYLHFIDTAQRNSFYSKAHKKEIRGSNLCVEILLATTEDKTAVCCISSINASEYQSWSDNRYFIKDLVEMLDNALEVFINEAPAALKKAVKSAMWERSLGLGLMGMHSLMQKNLSVFGEATDTLVTKVIQKRAILASQQLGVERGVPEAAKHLGRRNTHLMAIAPNAASSIMLGVSPGIEPWRSNQYTIKQGELIFGFVNPDLKRLLTFYGEDTKSTWDSIRANRGSVQHLDFLTPHEKLVFRSALEIDQCELVAAASMRQPYVCQAQSLTLFFEPKPDPKEVVKAHTLAYTGVEGGQPLKTLYYTRGPVEDFVQDLNVQSKREEPVVEKTASMQELAVAACSIDNKECLSCGG